MTSLLVFDPALCCSTGVCGPEVDDDLVRFAADVEWLKIQGVEVRRYNLAQEPGAFAATEVVQRSLVQQGVSCLPLLIRDGEVVASGAYPARTELMRIAGLPRESADAQTRTSPRQSLPVQDCAPGSGCC
jgi:hypothetical protein